MKKPAKLSSATAFSGNGKPLYGTAAQLRCTSLAGGWDKLQRDLITCAATEAVSRLWCQILARYQIIPYRETQAQGQGDHSHAEEIHDSANPSSSRASHDCR